MMALLGYGCPPRTQRDQRELEVRTWPPTPIYNAGGWFDWPGLTVAVVAADPCGTAIGLLTVGSRTGRISGFDHIAYAAENWRELEGLGDYDAIPGDPEAIGAVLSRAAVVILDSTAPTVPVLPAITRQSRIEFGAATWPKDWPAGSADIIATAGFRPASPSAVDMVIAMAAALCRRAELLPRYPSILAETLVTQGHLALP